MPPNERPLEDDAGSWAERATHLAEGSPDIHAYEVRVEVTEERRWIRRDGEPQGVTGNHVGGIGVRAYHGDGRGYAYCNEPSEMRLREVVERAGRLARSNAQAGWSTFPPRLGDAVRVRSVPRVDGHPRQDDPHHALELLERAEDALQEGAPEATTQVAFGSREQRTVLATSAGSWVERESLLTTLLVQALVRGSGRQGEGNDWAGGERGFHDYEGSDSPEALGRRVAERAREDLEARAVPAGRYRTLTDERLTGLLVHESFGHLTEYDLVASGWSILRGRRGERLADPRVTIRDTPTVEGEPQQGVRVPHDHEGTPGRPVTLLDEGRLTGYLHHRDSAPAEADAATGNARALHVHHPPIVRMRNTFMEPGDLTREEALELVGDGVYLQGGRGGAPRSDGSFTFTAQHGYRVRDGELAEPVRMATLHGNVLDLLQGVRGLTRELHVDTTSFGGCGKWDQINLPVGIGGPHAVVEEVLVGGRSS